MKKEFLVELQTQMPYLSTVEKKIAEEIIRDPRTFVEWTMAELSERIGVSQGSIVNFAKKFTSGGFPRLKVAVASCIVGENVKQGSAATIDNGLQAYKKVTDGLQSAIHNTAGLNSDGAIERVAELILAAKKVELCGVYRSGLVANDFYYQLLDIGIPAIFIPDFYSAAVSASMLESDCVLIAISHTGRTREVLDAAMLAKENGAKIVVITKNRFSPIAKLADEVLISTACDDFLTATANEVRMSQLALTDAVCEYLSARMDQESEQRFSRNLKIRNMHSVED